MVPVPPSPTKHRHLLLSCVYVPSPSTSICAQSAPHGRRLSASLNVYRHLHTLVWSHLHTLTPKKFCFYFLASLRVACGILVP